MKKTIIAAVAALSAFAASATTTVGVDYGYLRANGDPYVASHTVIASVKQSLGALGNVKLGVGGAQAVTNVRDNGYAFGAEYSYDFATPIGKLSPAVGVQRITSMAGGNYDSASVGALLRTPVADKTRLVTGVGYTWGINGADGESTTVGLGVEYDVTKAITLKGGYAYTRLTSVGRNANGLTAGIEVKF